jgi:DNA-binding response OmpR family regulator
MFTILLTTAQPDRFEALQEALSTLHSFTFSRVSTGHTALERVRNAAVDLVIIDEELEDMAGVDLVRRLLEVDAMINTVLVTTAPPNDFHERTEGLGILMPLPPVCGQAEALQLTQHLNRLALLTNP